MASTRVVSDSDL